MTLLMLISSSMGAFEQRRFSGVPADTKHKKALHIIAIMFSKA